MIQEHNIHPGLMAKINGQLLGDIFYLDGDAGDDNATGEDQTTGLKSLKTAVGKLVDGHQDYILAFGAETAVASVEIAESDAHIIGIGGGGAGNLFNRGYQYTCIATDDTLQTTTAADGAEIAGISFIQHATSHILIDDAGAEGVWFHHNTTLGGAAITAILLDLEGARWVLNDNYFFVCKLAIDTIGKETIIKDNFFQSVDAAALGVNLGANTADRCVVDHNIFNLSGGTGDKGIVIVSGADQASITRNRFHVTCADNIDDSGTGTFLSGNYEGAITGTSTSSLELAIAD